MGTEITLDVGGMSVDYSKNSMGSDHGSLFQKNDITFYKSNVVDYDYFAEHKEDPKPYERAFVKKLRNVITRIELLGFNLEGAKRAYSLKVEQCLSYADEVGEEMDSFLNFEDFSLFVKNVDIASLDDTYIEDDGQYDFFTKKEPPERFTHDHRVKKIPRFDYEDFFWSEKSYFANLLSFLHPYYILLLLAENEKNLDLDVVWQFGPLVENGWESVEKFEANAKREQRILLVTEGSSDSKIIKRAFERLYPEITDFFQFIDMEKGYPFTGAGNLENFAKGLTKIGIQNKTIFLLDNDAEGINAFNNLQKISMPGNIKAIKLPSLDKFKYFKSIGPNGEFESDINGQAVAIECFLDLNFNKKAHHSNPRIRWSNYKKDVDAYQGVLEHKESYVKTFLSETKSNIPDGYNISKLSCLLDLLIKTAKELAGELYPT